MSSEELAAGREYRIAVVDGRVVFHRAHGGGARLAGFIAAGLAFLLVVNGAIQVFMAHGSAAVGLILLGLVATVLSWRLLTAPQSGSQVELANGQLRDPAGRALAGIQDLRLATSIDWADGMGGFRLARVLWIRWAGGKHPIYKTYDKAELAAVMNRLAEHGLGTGKE